MKLEYDLLVAESPLPRNERINVGIVLWKESGFEIICSTSASRLASLDRNYPRISIFKELISGTLGDSIAEQLSDKNLSVESARIMLGFLIKPLRTVPGGVMFSDDGDFTNEIERTLDALVRPSKFTVKIKSVRKSNKLESQFKHWLRSSKIMGRTMEDLSKHRVVPQYPVSVEADVYADFAYKNGALHVMETLDMRGATHVTGSLRNTAAFKSITLDMAADVVGSGKRIGIVAASDYSAIKSALKLFERNADEVFSMDSPNDTQRLANLLSTGLHIDGGLIPMDLAQ